MNIVKMSEFQKDFKAWQETMYLMKSSKNHQRLSDAIENVRKGKAKKKDLLLP